MPKPHPIRFLFKNFDPDYEEGMLLVTPKQIQADAARYGCTRPLSFAFSYQDATPRTLTIKPPAKTLDTGLFILGMKWAACFNANLEWICGDNTAIRVPRETASTVMRLPPPAHAETATATKADHIAAIWSGIKPQFDAHATARRSRHNTQLELFALTDAETCAVVYHVGQPVKRLVA